MTFGISKIFKSNLGIRNHPYISISPPQDVDLQHISIWFLNFKDKPTQFSYHHHCPYEFSPFFSLKIDLFRGIPWVPRRFSRRIQATPAAPRAWWCRRSCGSCQRQSCDGWRISPSPGRRRSAEGEWEMDWWYIPYIPYIYIYIQVDPHTHIYI